MFPATREYFYKEKTAKDNLNSWCKTCYKEYTKLKRKTLEFKQQQEKYVNKWGSGVYGIFENGICLYVGESKILAKRFTEHNSYNSAIAQYLKKHSNYVIGILEQTKNHLEKEKYYINKLKPKYNAYGL